MSSAELNSNLKKLYKAVVAEPKAIDQNRHVMIRALYFTLRKIAVTFGAFLLEGKLMDIVMLSKERNPSNIAILIAFSIVSYFIAHKLRERSLFTYTLFWKFSIKFFLLLFLNPELMF